MISYFLILIYDSFISHFFVFLTFDETKMVAFCTIIRAHLSCRRVCWKRKIHTNVALEPF